jgi:putative peptide zinc metalloprotease protein
MARDRHGNIRGMKATGAQAPRRGVLVALALVAVMGPGASPAAAAGGNNVVLAMNEVDDSHHSRSGVMVAIAAGDTVDSENLAFATSNCHNCRTVAVAMQAVLITSDASIVAPQNAAVAVNENCSSCQTMAAAYQYVVTTGGPVHLSAHGQQQLARLRQAAAAAAASGLSFSELEAEFDGLYEQLRAVIDHEVVSAGGTPAGTVARQLRTDAA